MRKILLNNIFLIFFSLIMFLSCSDSAKVDYELPTPFSIRINNELTFEGADSLRILLKSQIQDSLYIVNDDDFYFVNIGYFNSSLTAGTKAFNLFCDSLISNYSIYYGDSAQVYDEYRYIPYLGEDLNRPAIVKYDLLKKKSRLIWSKWGRKIINFSYPKNFSPAYFLTALTFGREAGFPFITDVRAYKYNVSDNSVKRLEKLGKGLQVFANYDTAWNYEVYFNILDSTNTSNIIQLKNVYNRKNQKIESTERVFSILNDGYPAPKLSLPQLVSPSKNFYVKAEASDSTISYFLNNYKKNKRDFIFSSKMELSKVEWNSSEEYLILSLKDLSDSNNSTLLVVNTKEVLIINEIKNYGAVNFIVHGDLLIFDNWKEVDSQIIIQNYKTGTPYDTLNVPGGCGLSYIKSEYIGY